MRENEATHDHEAVGPPLSPVRRSGPLLFVSGQVPDSTDAEAAAQTEEVLEKIARLLKACGCTLGDVVKTTVFLADRDDYEEMNRVYRRFFPTDPPARSTVCAQLVVAAKIEIEAIALQPPRRKAAGAGT